MDQNFETYMVVRRTEDNIKLDECGFYLVCCHTHSTHRILVERVCVARCSSLAEALELDRDMRKIPDLINVLYLIFPHTITLNLSTMSNTREITVLYFAAASTATGLTYERIPLPPTADPFTLSSLPSLLVSRHPNTPLDKVLEGSQWSVDAEMVDDTSKVILKGGEEVAVICPVSGG